MNSLFCLNRSQSKKERDTSARSILATFVPFFISVLIQAKNLPLFLVFFYYFKYIPEFISNGRLTSLGLFSKRPDLFLQTFKHLVLFTETFFKKLDWSHLSCSVIRQHDYAQFLASVHLHGQRMVEVYPAQELRFLHSRHGVHQFLIVNTFIHIGINGEIPHSK